MDYKNLKIGDKIGNKDIASLFQCTNQGGIRKSNKTKTIILIAKFTECLYKHKKENDIVYFTGMGKIGNQELKRQNKAVAEAKENDFYLHLFEMYEEGVYTYCGEVELIGVPSIEEQRDDNGKIRDVFIFPLKYIEKVV
ncbi:restriction endonuclease [uncultured Ilyobacter sp.]|uniref:restriction endonuclease n=1 Tax=uncultured Ilyobacter sp. TaxID=544433 RepID=UPI0029C976BF|nr:restriction endonuclease [uncultured Ilyobacter sp.]